VLLAALALLAALKGVRDQLWLQTFAEDTRRYNDIVRELPAQSRRPNSSFLLESVDHDERDRVFNTARAYLNLCSEEFYLHSRGRIDDETWDIWRLGIIATVRLPWMQQTWNELQDEYQYFEGFCTFIGTCIEAAEEPQRAAVGTTGAGDGSTQDRSVTRRRAETGAP
jgi:hypothetical protein